MRSGFSGVLLIFLLTGHSALSQSRLVLNQGWSVQSVGTTSGIGGEIVSRPNAGLQWHPTTVPSTFLGALIQNQVYTDPFFGTNLQSIPGTTFTKSVEDANSPPDPNTPFRGTPMV